MVHATDVKLDDARGGVEVAVAGTPTAGQHREHREGQLGGPAELRRFPFAPVVGRHVGPGTFHVGLSMMNAFLRSA